MDQEDGRPFALPSVVEPMTRGIVAAEPGLEDETTTHDRNPGDMSYRVCQQQEEPELDHDEIRREGAAGTSATPWITAMVPSIVATAFASASLNACTSPAQTVSARPDFTTRPYASSLSPRAGGNEVDLVFDGENARAGWHEAHRRVAARCIGDGRHDRCGDVAVLLGEIVTNGHVDLHLTGRDLQLPGPDGPHECET